MLAPPIPRKGLPPSQRWITSEGHGPAPSKDAAPGVLPSPRLPPVPKREVAGGRSTAELVTLIGAGKGRPLPPRPDLDPVDVGEGFTVLARLGKRSRPKATGDAPTEDHGVTEDMFHPVGDLPPPPPFTNSAKVYPSVKQGLADVDAARYFVNMPEVEL